MKLLVFIGIAIISMPSFGLEVTECLLTSDRKGNESAINEYIVKNGRPLTISTVEVGRINPVVPETEFIVIKGFHTPSSVREYTAAMASSDGIEMTLEGCSTRVFE